MLRSVALTLIVGSSVACGGEGQVSSSTTSDVGGASSAQGGSSTARGGSSGATNGGNGGLGGHGGESTGGNGAGSGGSSAGGAGGVGGSGGSGRGGSGGSGGAATNGELGAPCSWGGAKCQAGLFCDAPGCVAGTCQPKLNVAAQQQVYDPVCGCDGVHHFNPTVAQSRAMAVRHAGLCTTNEEVACDKTNAPCGAGLSCSIQVASQPICAPTLTAGVCWAAPLVCSTGQPQARGCLGDVCANKCALVRSQNGWFEDATCP